MVDRFLRVITICHGSDIEAWLSCLASDFPESGSRSNLNRFRLSAKGLASTSPFII